MKNVEYDFRTKYFPQHDYGGQFYCIIRSENIIFFNMKSLVYVYNPEEYAYNPNLLELRNSENPLQIKNYFKVVVEI